MSQCTSLHIVPVNDAEWIPDSSLIRDIMNYLNCTKTWFMSGYSKPMYWDAMEDFYDHELFTHSDLSIDEAIDVWSQRSTIVTYVGLTCEDWSEKLSESTGSIPESLSEGLTLYETSMTFGPFSIPSLDYETTIGRYCFQIKLSGSGMPYDPVAYFELVHNDPVVVGMLSFLKEKTGKEWTTLMSC